MNDRRGRRTRKNERRLRLVQVQYTYLSTYHTSFCHTTRTRTITVPTPWYSRITFTHLAESVHVGAAEGVEVGAVLLDDPRPTEQLIVEEEADLGEIEVTCQGDRPKQVVDAVVAPLD